MDAKDTQRAQSTNYRFASFAPSLATFAVKCGMSVVPQGQRRAAETVLNSDGADGEARMPDAADDKDAIRELLAEYCFQLDDGRFAEMAALFTEDGTWDTAFGKAVGRTAIADLARSLREEAGAARPRAVHLVTNIAVALAGETAAVRSNWMVMQNGAAGPKIGSGGAYFDQIVKTGGNWRFRHRKIDRFIVP